MQKLHKNAEKLNAGQTDGRTDEVTFRVACTRLKKRFFPPWRWFHIKVFISQSAGFLTEPTAHRKKVHYILSPTKKSGAMWWSLSRCVHVCVQTLEYLWNLHSRMSWNLVSRVFVPDGRRPGGDYVMVAIAYGVCLSVCPDHGYLWNLHSDFDETWSIVFLGY